MTILFPGSFSKWVAAWRERNPRRGPQRETMAQGDESAVGIHLGMCRTFCPAKDLFRIRQTLKLTDINDQAWFLAGWPRLVAVRKKIGLSIIFTRKVTWQVPFVTTWGNRKADQTGRDALGSCRAGDGGEMSPVSNSNVKVRHRKVSSEAVYPDCVIAKSRCHSWGLMSTGQRPPNRELVHQLCVLRDGIKQYGRNQNSWICTTSIFPLKSIHVSDFLIANTNNSFLFTENHVSTGTESILFSIRRVRRAYKPLHESKKCFWGWRI